MFGASPFQKGGKSIAEQIQKADIVFVSDFFIEDYAGGAELTTQALIDASPNLEISKIHSSDVSLEALSGGMDKYWIFTNFAGLNPELIPSIIANLQYSIVEYDFKYCVYRSPEKHEFETGEVCNCHNEMNGKMVSAFFHGANSLFWMSESQRDTYIEKFPFLSQKRNVTVTSVFSKEFFQTISDLHTSEKDESYVIVGSESWIKGVSDSVNYCEDKGLPYEVVSDLTHEKMLEKMASSKGMVFLPRGGDTCPRTVIEAKLLGCELIINENVMHKDEDWFSSDDIKKTLNWLSLGPSRFWGEVNRSLNRQPTISGYTTTLNCIKQNYPFEASIKSMLGFCDQVVIVDGGSTDGTVERLRDIESKNSNVIVHIQERDWESKRFAVFDGLQKALARALCTGEFCWQQDSDEIIHERDFAKIKELTRKLPKSMDLIALPVIEFWGRKGKIRIDATPWKWRMSRNKPHITHGIPASLRKFDKEGNLYSGQGTDGCDYIRSDTFEPVPFVNFYSEEIHKVRESALLGNQESLNQYGGVLQSICASLPAVIHYSWYDIERKIHTYKNYWSRHWQSLYDIEQEDTPENNMFFNKPWKDIEDSDISMMARKLEDEMGGWIFHSKVDFSKPTPYLSVGEDFHPPVVRDWINSTLGK